MNLLAENILYLYLIIFLSVLGFDIACIVARKANEKRLEKLKQKMIVFLLHNQKNFHNLKFQKKLIHKLKKINYFIVFTNIMKEMPKESQRNCLKCLKYTFLKILPHYKKQEVIRQTYFVHFLKEHPYIYSDNKNEIINYLLKCTTESSIYLRENALNALYVVGNVEYIKEAFSKMNYLNIQHHHKLITDGLLKFQENKEELSKMLMQELDNYQENYQIACINYFNYKKIDCKKYIYEKLSNESTPKEVRLACIRYFKNNLYEEVVPLLYQLLQSNKKNWEYAAVAASTLASYKSKETTKQLITSLTSYNWYIRNNAAMSLTISNNEDILNFILQNITDKYAQDALAYQMKLKKKGG